MRIKRMLMMHVATNRFKTSKTNNKMERFCMDVNRDFSTRDYTVAEGRGAMQVGGLEQSLCESAPTTFVTDLSSVVDFCHLLAATAVIAEHTPPCSPGPSASLGLYAFSGSSFLHLLRSLAPSFPCLLSSASCPLSPSSLPFPVCRFQLSSTCTHGLISSRPHLAVALGTFVSLL